MVTHRVIGIVCSTYTDAVENRHHFALTFRVLWLRTGMRFRGKTVWITGASSGIGAALARAMTREQAVVVLSARRRAELEKVALSCSGKVHILPFDVTAMDALPQMVEQAWGLAGHIDVLINNAGISQRSRAIETSMDVYRRLMEVDFFAPLRLTQLILPRMLQRGAGQLVAIASVAGKFGAPLRTGYCAAKHALIGYSDALRAELAGTGVDVSVVVPGYVRTSIAEHALVGNGDAAQIADSHIEAGMDADKAASVIVDGLAKRKREINVGKGREMRALTLKRIWPEKLFDIVAKEAKKSS